MAKPQYLRALRQANEPDEEEYKKLRGPEAGFRVVIGRDRPTVIRQATGYFLRNPAWLVERPEKVR